ncbi:MAG TPA: hypothetical protein VFH45_08215, partial [Acidimicrobiales bacterium]|nr:hypothetical protein [Acidimicrobiales bacterium]
MTSAHARLARDPFAQLTIGFAILRCVAAVGGTPVVQPDSSSYTAGPIAVFGGYERLWTVPLFFHLIPNDHLR